VLFRTLFEIDVSLCFEQFVASRSMEETAPTIKANSSKGGDAKLLI